MIWSVDFCADKNQKQRPGISFFFFLFLVLFFFFYFLLLFYVLSSLQVVLPLILFISSFFFLFPVVFQVLMGRGARAEGGQRQGPRKSS